MEQSCHEKVAKVKRCRERGKYYRTKVQKLNNSVESGTDSDSESDKESDLEEEVNELKEKLKVEKEHNEWLESLLEDNSDVPIYNTEKRSFTPKMTLCVYDLLQSNVATSKIPRVIETVLALVDRKTNRLPSSSTVKNMNIARLICAQKQVGEKLSTEEDTCLMSDETSKFGKKVQGFHLSDSSGSPWILGLRDLQSKSSEHVLSSFKEVLTYIDESAKCTDNAISKHLLYNISTTMSDKAATESKFQDLLQDYRKDVLPEIVQNYEDLPAIDKEKVSTLHKFFLWPSQPGTYCSRCRCCRP